jgi:cobalt/nickel transport system permease protein
MKTLDRGHVPDWGTISFYSERGGPLNRVSPWTKLMGLLVFILAVTIAQNLLILAAAYAVSVAVYAAGRLPLGKLVRWYFLPVLYTITIAILFVFDEPAEGISLVVQLLLRALTVVTYSLALVLTTRFSEVTALAERLLPRPFDAIFMLTYHFIFVFFETMDRILLAAWARGGSFTRGIRELGSLYAKIFAYGVIFSFDRAERVGKAMEARGFNGSLHSFEEIRKPSFYGVCILAISVVVLFLIYFYQGLIP